MPCTLAERIQKDMVAAMKSRDERTLSALRMLKTSMQLASTEKGRGGELADEDIQALIRRGVKQREEAAQMYKNGGALERAENEMEEARVLVSYLPAQLDDSELGDIVGSAIESLGASGLKDMGRVMSRVMQDVSGRADGRRVKDAVQKRLGG
jgi:uncharacterized protein YqeY